MDSIRCNYDVFLSYKPKDTLKKFTGHLYTALDRADIRTFGVYDDSSIGDDIRLVSHRAIQESRVSIIVFSQNYVNSSSCRDELVRILERSITDGQLVIPVFYEVNPVHVLEQLQSYGIAFEAANLSDWDMRVIANGHEAKIIQKIVGYVRHKAMHIKLQVAKHPIGLDSRVENLTSLSRIGSDDVRMVGLYGMGGIGKTTLAKAFYNMSFHLFEGSCFLANVRERSKQPNGIARLQTQLLLELLKEKKKIYNEHIGIATLEERLGRKKVLIVLDDLDELSQLEALAGQRCWFSSGSRIMITTRNEHLLIQARADDRYEVKRLNPFESLRLFSLHAFKRNIPLKKFTQISNEVVSYAAGVPLALEVLGSSLIGRTLAQWISTLDKLQEIPDQKIQSVLRISFDALDDDDVKNIFLDIACFFNGAEKGYLIDGFKACGFFPIVGIRILVDRCLLSDSVGHRVRMHDLLQDMGRHIVRSKFPNEPGKHSRLWLLEEVCQVLSQQKGTNEIEGIVLDTPTQMHINTIAFANMHKLRLLQIENTQLSGSFDGLFEDLKWFTWYNSLLESLPTDFHPKKLVFLDMQNNNMNALWHGMKLLTNLKVLNLSQSKRMIASPDLSGTPNLEQLTLYNCKSLLKIHPSIGCLDRLTDLIMEGCNSLQFLPSSICKPKSLKYLNLRNCLNLEQLPEDIGNLKCLKILVVDNTAIKALPDSIGLLDNLTELNLNFCPNLSSLPSNVCNLRSIKWLFITRCPKLDQLPDQLGNITSLNELHIGGTAINHLPDSIGLLKNLTLLSNHENCRNTNPKSRFLSFKLSSCATSFLPPSIAGLRSLSKLNLSYCNLSDADIPDDLNGLSSLSMLDLRENNFCILPSSLGQLTSLEILFLSRCWKLKSVLKFPPNLHRLTAGDCRSLENIPNLSNMKFLKYLDLEGCCKLANIMSLQNLNCTQEFFLEGCKDLSSSFAYSLFHGYSGHFLNCSLYLPRVEIPHWFEHQRLGSSISFVVENDYVELTIWVDYVREGELPEYVGPHNDNISIVLHNTANGIKWFHYGYLGTSTEPGPKTWVSFGSQPYPLKTGDRIEVSLKAYGKLEVEKCGVRLAYKPIIKPIERSSLFITETDGLASTLKTSRNF